MAAAPLDYLPYVDDELTAAPRLRVQADALIIEECRRRGGMDAEAVLAAHGFATSAVVPLEEMDDAQADAPRGHLTPFLVQELQFVAKHGARKAAVAEEPRYELVPAPDETASADEWDRAVRHNRIVLERVENDLINSELEAKFGESGWKVYAQAMEGLAQRASHQLRAVEDEIIFVNQTRKGAHIAAHAKVTALRAKWADHIEQIRSIKAFLARKGAAPGKRGLEQGAGAPQPSSSSSSSSSNGNNNNNHNTNNNKRPRTS